MANVSSSSHSNLLLSATEMELIQGLVDPASSVTLDAVVEEARSQLVAALQPAVFSSLGWEQAVASPGDLFYAAGEMTRAAEKIQHTADFLMACEERCRR